VVVIGVGSSSPISKDGFVTMYVACVCISMSVLSARLAGDVSKRVSLAGGDMSPAEPGLLVEVGSYSSWMLDTSDTERECGS
jgi:hypothetical protein